MQGCLYSLDLWKHTRQSWEVSDQPMEIKKQRVTHGYYCKSLFKSFWFDYCMTLLFPKKCDNMIIGWVRSHLVCMMKSKSSCVSTKQSNICQFCNVSLARLLLILQKINMLQNKWRQTVEINLKNKNENKQNNSGQTAVEWNKAVSSEDKLCLESVYVLLSNPPRSRCWHPQVASVSPPVR